MFKSLAEMSRFVLHLCFYALINIVIIREINILVLAETIVPVLAF